jgi:hypothetical protein
MRKGQAGEIIKMAAAIKSYFFDRVPSSYPVP